MVGSKRAPLAKTRTTADPAAEADAQISAYLSQVNVQGTAVGVVAQLFREARTFPAVRARFIDQVLPVLHDIATQAASAPAEAAVHLSAIEDLEMLVREDEALPAALEALGTFVPFQERLGHLAASLTQGLIATHDAHKDGEAERDMPLGNVSLARDLVVHLKLVVAVLECCTGSVVSAFVSRGVVPVLGDLSHPRVSQFPDVQSLALAGLVRCLDSLSGRRAAESLVLAPMVVALCRARDPGVRRWALLGTARLCEAPSSRSLAVACGLGDVLRDVLVTPEPREESVAKAVAPPAGQALAVEPKASRPASSRGKRAVEEQELRVAELLLEQERHAASLAAAADVCAACWSPLDASGIAIVRSSVLGPLLRTALARIHRARESQDVRQGACHLAVVRSAVAAVATVLVDERARRLVAAHAADKAAEIVLALLLTPDAVDEDVLLPSSARDYWCRRPVRVDSMRAAWGRVKDEGLAMGAQMAEHPTLRGAVASPKLCNVLRSTVVAMVSSGGRQAQPPDDGAANTPADLGALLSFLLALARNEVARASLQSAEVVGALTTRIAAAVGNADADEALALKAARLLNMLLLTPEGLASVRASSAAAPVPSDAPLRRLSAALQASLACGGGCVARSQTLVACAKVASADEACAKALLADGAFRHLVHASATAERSLGAAAQEAGCALLGWSPSAQLWWTRSVSTDVRTVDGFFDLGASRAWSSLDDIRMTPFHGEAAPCSEVLVADAASDSALVLKAGRVQASVAAAAGAGGDRDIVLQMQVSLGRPSPGPGSAAAPDARPAAQELVVESMGGWVPFDAYENYSAEAEVLRVMREEQSFAIPIGKLTRGTARHRAFLFKVWDPAHSTADDPTPECASPPRASTRGQVLADRAGVPCSLTAGPCKRGAHSHHSWNVVILGDEHYVVDLLHEPGQLLKEVRGGIARGLHHGLSRRASCRCLLGPTATSASTSTPTARSTRRLVSSRGARERASWRQSTGREGASKQYDTLQATMRGQGPWTHVECAGRGHGLPGRLCGWSQLRWPPFPVGRCTLMRPMRRSTYAR